jgi:hypothetical protein
MPLNTVQAVYGDEVKFGGGQFRPFRTGVRPTFQQANPSVKVWDKQRTVPHQRPWTLSSQMLS